MNPGRWSARGALKQALFAASVSVFTGALIGPLSAQDEDATGNFPEYLNGSEGNSDGYADSSYISFDFKDKDIHEVLRFISSRVGVNVIAEKNVRENVTVTFDKVSWRNALKVIAQQTNCRIVEESERLLVLTQPPTISMEFQDADIKVVLDLLAKQAGVNIVMDSAINGQVTLSLRDVPWREALDTLVKTAGYVLVREDTSSATEILRVVPPEALKQQLETRHFTLRYVRPPEPYVARMSGVETLTATTVEGDSGGVDDGAGADGATINASFQLETALSRVVSEDGGSLEFDANTNTFIIKDIKPKLDEIAHIIKLVDVPPPQVYVEVKFVRTTNSDLYERGIKFDLSSTPERDGFQVGARFSEVGEFLTAAPTDPLAIFGGTFPFDIGRSDGNALGVTGFQALGLLDFRRTEALLRMVKDDERSRIVQEPALTMINNRPAVIFVGETIPFAVQQIQQDQNGNITVAIDENDRSPINIGFTLYIVPHVIPGTDLIDLSVIPKVSSLSGTTSTIEGFERFEFQAPGSATQSFIDLPRESSQTVVTYMRVQDGQTAVIGGLQTERRIEIESKIPVLSSIPVLGNLFTWKRKTDDIESLLILITPRILKSIGQQQRLFDEVVDRHKRADYFYETYEKPFEDDEPAEN